MLIPEEKNGAISRSRLDRAHHRQAQEVVDLATCRLSRHFMFQGHLKCLELQYQEGTLVVTGELPSFYLKQVLQTALRDLPGINRIENRVVVSTNGTGSPRSQFQD